jgi:hypothetical protein
LGGHEVFSARLGRGVNERTQYLIARLSSFSQSTRLVKACSKTMVFPSTWDAALLEAKRPLTEAGRPSHPRLAVSNLSSSWGRHLTQAEHANTRLSLPLMQGDTKSWLCQLFLCHQARTFIGCQARRRFSSLKLQHTKIQCTMSSRH